MRHARSFQKKCLAIVFSLALSTNSALAATITVDTGDDGATGCTLRSAIASVNAAQMSGECSGVGEFGIDDVIDFRVASVNGLTSSLNITSSVSINPSGESVMITSLGNGSVFDIRDSEVSLNNVIVSGGNSSRDGGGIFLRDGALRLSNSVVTGNSAGNDGGGIFARNSVLVLNSSTIANNSASAENQVGDDGGGIHARSSTVTINMSTVSGNRANDEGAGIYTTSSSVTVNNSTISGNYAGDEGGGILVDFNSNVTLTHTTVANNSAGRNGGGLSVEAGSLSLGNSLLTGNMVGDGVIVVSELFVGAAGGIDFFGNNLLGDSSKTTREATNVAPTGNVMLRTSDSPRATPLANILAPLADNEGPTLTHALVEGSPAIDTASNGVCATARIRERDQRDFVRVGRCDIGALEFGAAPPVFNPAIIVPPIFLLLLHDD